MRALLFALLVLLAAVVAPALALLLTPWGLNLLWSAAAPPGLEVQQLRGSLRGPIDVEGLRYRSPGLDLDIGRLRIAWQPARLLAGTLHIIDLGMSDLQVATRPAADGDQELPEVSLPLRLRVDRLLVERMDIRAGDREPQRIERVEAAFALDGTGLQLDGLAVDAPQGSLSAAGTLLPRGDYATRLEVAWALRLPGMPELQAAGLIDGNREALRVQQRLSAPTAVSVDVLIRDPLERRDWQATLDAAPAALAAIDPRLPALTIGGQVTAAGRGSDARGQLDLRVDTEVLGTLEISGGAALRAGRIIDLEALRVTSTETDAGVSANGRIDLRRDVPQLALGGRWEGLQWPLDGEVRYTSRSGVFRLDGTPEDWLLEVSADLGAAGLEARLLSLRGEGTREAFRIQELRAEALGGTLQAEGQVSWTDGIVWQLDAAGTDLDPAGLAAEWPGSLALQAASRGSLRDGTLTADVEVGELAGRLRGYPLRAKGRLRVADGAYQAEQLEVVSGRSRLELSGSLDSEIDAEWRIDTPDLAELWPGSRGTLRGSGSVGGSADAPRISANLRGSGLSYEGWSMARLESEVELDLAAAQASRIRLRSSGIRQNQQPFGDLSLSAVGTASKHVLDLKLDGPGPRLGLELAGGLAEGVWKGQVVQADVEAPGAGTWRVEGKPRLSLSKDAAALARSCWLSAGQQACIAGEWARDRDWSVSAQVSRLELGRLAGAVPGEQPLDLPFDLQGQLDATLDAAGRADEPRRVHLRASTGRSTLRTKGKGEPIAVGIERAELSLAMDGKASEAELTVISDVPGATPLEARLSLPPLPVRAWQEAPLTGLVRASLQDISPYAGLLPDVSRLEGRADVEATVAGTLAAPRFDGRAVLEASLGVPRLGINLPRLRIDLSGNRDAVSVSGSAESGEGRLELSGRIEPDAARGWPATLQLTGENFEAANLPQAWVLVSPDLTVRHEHSTVRVEGEVLVPKARLEPQPGSGAVRPSSDVVLVGESGERAEADDRWKVESRVVVKLGEEVVLKASGFEGKLRGEITAMEGPAGTTATGELHVVDGRVGAYGQTLDIERGRVAFVGGPIDDPALDVRAVRKSGSVTAGVQVEGRARDPQVTLFSTPTMRQDEILAFLLTGETSGNADASLLMRGAAALGFRRGKGITDKLAQSFGLDQLDVGGDPENPQLSIGKYLSPRLYLSYGTGLVEPGNLVRIRYILSKNWSLEAETGTSSGADLLYNLER